LEEKIDKFALIFNEKDKMLEEKNKVIFLLQQRIGELETKIQTMIALPDYTKEKQEAIQEKQKLEARLQQLTSKLKEQEMKTFILIGFAVILIAVAIFLYVRMNG
jgi:tRNA U34 5-carboxymethylaminomethyl modifying GTPase MnmE/TrmE